MFAAEDSMYSHILSLQLKQEKQKWSWGHQKERLEMQMAWEVINSVLTLGHESRQKLVKTPQAQTFSLLSSCVHQPLLHIWL